MADRPSAPRRRARRDALEHRRQILAAAKRLFASQGVDGTSMCEIARAAGVGQGTLYRHFAHKAVLCQAMIRDDLEAFEARVVELISGPDAPADALARLDILNAEKIRLTDEHLPLFAVIEAAAVYPRRREPFRSPFHTWLRGQYAALLAEAIDRGEIEPLDVELTADAILAVLSPPLLGHQRRDRGYSVERIVAGAHRLFVEGLRRGPAGGSRDCLD